MYLSINLYSSVHTQLPYDYYSLKYCRPKLGVKPYSENLGEFLTGDRIENSPYEIFMLQEEYCKVLCQTELKTKDVNDFKQAIKRQYHNNWIIDNLPAASIMDSEDYVNTQYVGFPVGYIEGNSYFLYNHVNVVLEYHTVDTDSHRIVGFYVEPLSVKHVFAGGNWDGKGDAPPLTSCKSTAHLDFDSVKDQINGNLMNGFISNAIDSSHDPTNPIRMFDKTSAPILNSLAMEFAVFDKWFCSIPGPTDPNRAFAMSGPLAKKCSEH
jgi:transmembrane 9 superfamily protein 2/4